MKKKRALSASRIPDDYDDTPKASPIWTIRDSGMEPNSIIFNTGPDNEMLRVAKDGFYVRGERVPADEKEAETVYNAFKEFLVYHNLSRTYT